MLDSIAPRTRIISTPAYGGSEGVLWLRIDHASSNRYDIYCSAYIEWPRPDFPICYKPIFMRKLMGASSP